MKNVMVNVTFEVHTVNKQKTFIEFIEVKQATWDETKPDCTKHQFTD